MTDDTLLTQLHQCINAINTGRLDILQKAFDDGRLPTNNITLCEQAARKGHLHILQWLRAHNCKWDEWTCNRAVLHGHFHILQWAHDNGCPWWKDEMCCRVVDSGNLNILKWLRIKGCPWNEDVCSNAAWFGNLTILKWAHENGCPWNRRTYTNALKNKHWHIVKWLLENNYFQDSENFAWDSLQCLAWVHNYRHKQFQLKINSIHEILLHVINIPDIVNLIKSYL